MKNTNCFLLLLLVILAFNQSFAQPSQFKLQVGYGVPLRSNPQWVTVSNNVTTISSFSLGSGLRVEGGVIKPITKSLSLQLDAAYLNGKKNALNTMNGTSYLNANFYSRFYDVSPMIRFTATEIKIKPYVAVGPIFGFGKFYRDADLGTTGATNTTTSRREYKGSFAFGSKAELGVQLQEGKITYYVQLTAISMGYSPTSSELTSYFSNSSNLLSALTVAQKKSVYVNSVTSSGTVDPNQPTPILKSSYNFDSFSLNVGVMISL
jgi:hypothetical protein